MIDPARADPQHPQHPQRPSPRARPSHTHLPPAAVARRRQRTLTDAAAQALAAAATYLPVLLMALLALATWWLVRSTPVPELPSAGGPARGEPDYTMEGFVVQRFDAQGGLRARIEGRHLRHFPDTDRLEIDDPRLLSLDEAGRATVASARRAVSNGDASEIALEGGARVRREGRPGEAPIEFQGEQVRASRLEERIVASSPVTVTQADSVIRADRAVYDHRTRVLSLEGRVRATFMPPALTSVSASASTASTASTARTLPTRPIEASRSRP